MLNTIFVETVGIKFTTNADVMVEEANTFLLFFIMYLHFVLIHHIDSFISQTWYLKNSSFLSLSFFSKPKYGTFLVGQSYANFKRNCKIC